MDHINYGAYEPYNVNHHDAEAQIITWAHEYGTEKAEGASIETLKSYLNDMIDETQR